MRIKTGLTLSTLLLFTACAQIQTQPHEPSSTAAKNPNAPTSIESSATTPPPGTVPETAGSSPVSPVGVVEPAATRRWPGKPIGGLFHCELGNKIESKVQSDDAVHVTWKGKTYAMNRVDTSSGAVRMEDKVSGLVWIQIPAKSFLLDSRKGQQLANECLVKQ